MDEFQFDFGFDKPNFQQQYGTGTIREQDPNTNGKNKSDAADIINAGANVLDSAAPFVSLFTGKPTPQTNTYTDPPPPKRKVNPLLVGSVIGGVVLLIIVALIIAKNGK